MKITFVCNEYPPAPHGGIGTFTQLASETLVAKGWEVRVIGYGADLPEHSFQGGVEVYRLRRARPDILSIRSRMQLFSRVAQSCREWKADVVEVPDAEGWCAAWPSLPSPVVVRIHGSASYFAAEMSKPVTLRSRLGFQIEKAALHRADFWCSVSLYAAEKTRALFGLKPCDAILHNAMELTEPDTVVARNPNMVVFTGTLTEKKGVLPLFRAWPSVLSRCPRAELHILGKDGRSLGGSMKSRLLSLLDESAKSSVFFHGHADRPALLQTLKAARLAALLPHKGLCWSSIPPHTRAGRHAPYCT